MIYRDFLLIIPRNNTIPVIKDWDFFLPGTFSGPSHPDNQGLAVQTFARYTDLIKGGMDGSSQDYSTRDWLNSH